MTTEQKVIRGKLGLLELGKELGNVSKACKMFGYSRDSYYRFKQQFETGGPEAMAEISRRKPNTLNRFSPEVEQAILDLSLDPQAALRRCDAATLRTGRLGPVHHPVFVATCNL
jgi:hypothetical protein